MSLKLTILGCHSATPRTFAHPTSQVLEINNHFFLIDCGEGTQTQLRKFKVKFSRIKHVFISHLHGDHFFGLIGLISTFGMLNRQTELHVFAPEGAEKIINLQLKLTKSWVQYPLCFHVLKSKKSELIFEDEKAEVFTIPLKHRIYTNGFLFKEKPGDRKLDMSKILHEEEIEICDYQNLKKGKDFVKENGEIIPNENLTTDPPKPLSYAYCSDTAYSEEITTLIKNISLLYHESTFLEDNVELAEKTKHSTALQAAMIAKQAEVTKLLLGHYSSRYKNLEDFKDEAQTVFQNTELAEEGKIFSIEN